MLAPSTVQKARCLQAHEAYWRYGSLQAAGDHLGLTRERVRQLIKRGVDNELFLNPIKKFLPPSKEVVVELLRKHGSLKRAALDSNISPQSFTALIEKYGIAQADLTKYAMEVRRGRCIKEYYRYRNSLGHDPTTTELENDIPKRGARALYARIVRYWDSFNSFRSELDVPVPRQGNPNLRSDVAEAFERRRQVAAIKREELEDVIVNVLKKHETGLRIRELCETANSKDATTRKILKQLIARGLVRKESVDSYILYVIERGSEA